METCEVRRAEIGNGPPFDLVGAADDVQKIVAGAFRLVAMTAASPSMVRE